MATLGRVSPRVQLPTAEACPSRAPARPTAQPNLPSPPLPAFLYFEEMKDFRPFLCVCFLGGWGWGAEISGSLAACFLKAQLC